MTRPSRWRGIEDWPPRRAHALDRWIVAWNPITKAWYARPKAMGVWATATAPLLYFPTLVAAGDYARSRTAKR
jgi:hypothetical protein